MPERLSSSVIVRPRAVLSPPSGATAQPSRGVSVIAESVFTITDPPLRAIRRFIKPIRLGNFSFDLAFLIVLVALNILIGVVQGLGRG
jgi:YggT family protein